MAEQKKWIVYGLFHTQTCQVSIAEIPFPADYTYSTRPSDWRELLCKVANRKWGGAEGKYWRIVQDQTVIGFHAVETASGDVLEIR
jgi:hypothetical protein